jgi:hypothetical protein
MLCQVLQQTVRVRIGNGEQIAVEDIWTILIKTHPDMK